MIDSHQHRHGLHHMGGLKSARFWLPIVILMVGGAIFFLSRPSTFDLPLLQLGGAPANATMASQPDFFIRVCLTDEPVRDVRLEIGVPFHIRASGSNQTLKQKPSWTGNASATSEGIRLGNELYRASRIDLIPDKSPAIWVNDHQYRGIIRLIRRKGDRLLAVNVLPLEDYLGSVIDSEMPKAFPVEARQAQAVMARSYALYQISRRGTTELFDVYAGVQSQKYLGYQYRNTDGKRLAGESEESRKIVEQTRGMVCLDGGKLFRTYYSAVCGGFTTRGRDVFPDTPLWLTGVSCDWCSAAERYRWNIVQDRGEFFRKINPLLNAGRPGREQVKSVANRSLSVIEPLNRQNPSSIPRFRVTHQGQQRIIDGVEIRGEIGTSVCYSPKFNVEATNTEIHLRGAGHGHGVGMCQWGARGQALEGKSCLAIVRYYYPGADVVVLVPSR